MKGELTKYTLTEALKIARAQSREEPPALWGPGMDQVPPATPVGQPVPEGVIVHQPAHPDQMPLALMPIAPCPSKAQQEAHEAIWAGIDRSTATLDEEKTEAARWWLPFPVPEKAPLPPDLLLLSEAAKELGYRSARGVIAFLDRYKYPPQYKVISRRGITELLRKKAGARRESKNNSQKATRANAVPEPKEQAQKKKPNVANRI
jgi:hypothetical protein